METVLFVCYNNAGRSLIAESIFNSRAAERKLDIHAESAGLMAVGAVHPMVLRCIEAVGIPVADLKPKPVTKEMIEEAGTIIGFGGINSDHSAIKFVITEQWPTVNPAGVPYGALCRLRDEIACDVERLLDRLSSPS